MICFIVLFTLKSTKGGDYDRVSIKTTFSLPAKMNRSEYQMRIKTL